jgi:hypothetical protein
VKLGKTLVLPIAAAALVVIGAGAVLASTGAGGGPSGTGSIVVPGDAPTAAPGTTAAPVLKSPYLTEVLDGLVTKGTITKAQEQAILDAWIAKRGTLMQERQANRQQLRAFLSDGVLTKAELDQLPADSPLRQLEPLMKNGQLTIADLRALGRGILRELNIGGAGRMGGGMMGGGRSALPTPSASPATGG